MQSETEWKQIIHQCYPITNNRMHHHVIKPYCHIEMVQINIPKFPQMVENIKHRAVNRQSKHNCLKGQISLSWTMKLHTLANACQSQEGKTMRVKNFQEDWYNDWGDAIEV